MGDNENVWTKTSWRKAMKEESCLKWVERYVVCCCLFIFIIVLWGLLEAPNSLAQTEQIQVAVNTDLARAKVFLQAGDYRRAVEACQRNIDHNPSVEAYVYLAYVYQAIDAYLAYLAKQEDYVKVEQLSLNLTAREVIDIIDPPNVMPRMAQELIHEGLRQQFDITASMANRLNRVRTDELWLQQSAWRESQPNSWWAGVPKDWQW
jgi:tetratricopeptide (TPR) repeat protein